MNSVNLLIEDSVALLTIDSVDSKVNVLTRSLLTELSAALEDLRVRPDVRGMVLASGKPGLFSAGADLKEFEDSLGANDPLPGEYVHQMLAVLRAMEDLPFPTVCCIDGVALGGGLELTLGCDERFVGTHPRVRLGMPEVALGLIPGFGGTQRLPRIIGPKTAADLILKGTQFDGPAAVAVSLAAKQVASEKLLGEAKQWVLQGNWRQARERKQGPIAGSEFADYRRQLPSGPTNKAASAALEVMEKGSCLPLGQAIVLETESFLKLTRSDEARQLIAAFFAGKKK